MKSEHDYPVCPTCKTKTGVPEDYNPDELFCPACGHSWAGNPEDIAQAKRAEAAYERRVEREEREAEKQRKADELRRRYEANLRGGW